MTDQCVFCDIMTGDLPSVGVAEDAATYAFMDIHPATAGHLLVVPKRHSRDLFDIPGEDLSAVTLAAQRIARVAVAELDADGVNLLNCCGTEAWQTVFHFHMHVIPRYADKNKDQLVLPWEPGTPGDTATIKAYGQQIADALK